MKRSLPPLLACIIVGLVFSLTLLVPGGTAQAQRWTDLTEDILGDYSITENEVSLISQGYLDNTWRPYQDMTRAQFVKMAVDRFGLSLIDPARSSFSDVPRGHQHYQYIQTAHTAGMVEGRADGSFGPQDTVTRAQAAAIIVRFLAHLEGTTIAELYTEAQMDAILQPFVETRAGIGPLAPEVAAAVDWGILRGTTDGRLNPFQELLRIQGAAMLIRAEIPPTQDVEVLVYFSRDGEIASAARTVTVGPAAQVATATMRQLLAGESQAERQVGMTTEIPAGTRLLGLVIADAVAAVDLSQEFTAPGTTFSQQMRLAQVVYALTQFPTVDAVQFQVQGQNLAELGGIQLQPSVSRPGGVDEPFENITPAIFVETPPVFGLVLSPLRATGTANVFEATFLLEIWDDADNLLAQEVVTATAGTGTRGTFDVTVPFAMPQTPTGRLVVYWESAQDGSPQDVIEIPITLADH